MAGARHRSHGSSPLALTLAMSYQDIVGPFRLLVSQRQVTAALVRQSLRDRVAASAFGFFFLAVYPLLFLGVYSFVFVHVLQVRVPDLSPEGYTLAIFCGLVPFLAFAEALTVGSGSIVGNATLVRNLMFPYEILPVRDVVASYVAMAPGFVMVLVAAVWDRGFHLSQLLVPLVVILQIMFSIGLAWLLATLNVFMRDIQKLLPIVVLMLMMISPIAYTRDMLPAGLATLALFNPLAGFIFLYRDMLFEGTVPLLTLLVMSVVSLAVFFLGFYVIRRLRPLVFDFV